MTFGQPWNQQQLNALLTQVAQGWVNVAAASVQLDTLIAGSGGESFLQGSQVGYDAADAAAVLAMIGQFNQLAGIVTGTGTLNAAFDFASAFAPAMTPADITIT